MPEPEQVGSTIAYLTLRNSLLVGSQSRNEAFLGSTWGGVSQGYVNEDLVNHATTARDHEHVGIGFFSA